MHTTSHHDVNAREANDYQPTARRPIAELFRRPARGMVAWCVRRGVHPDAISYGSTVASAAAAACFWQASDRPWLLLVGVALCYLRLWLNMLDGMVALAAGKASLRGEILNDLPDRISDVLIFVGIAHSGFCQPLTGYWAAILALFTAYVGTLGQAVGGRREFGGCMSKPWRMVVLTIGAVATFFALLRDPATMHAWPLTILDATNGLVIVGCLQTIAVRLKRIFAGLAERS